MNSRELVILYVKNGPPDSVNLTKNNAEIWILKYANAKIKIGALLILSTY